MNDDAPATMPDPSDVLALDSLLTPDELALRQRIRDFTDQRIRPNIGGWYDDAVFPLGLAPELGELGVLGMHLEGYGCPAEDPPSNTVLPRWNSKPATPGSARSCRYRGPWP